MSTKSLREILRGGLAVATAASLVLTLAVSEARAGDDGSAPIWEGIEGVFGPYLGFTKDDPGANIEYRERGRLVLPPKIALPPPSASAAQGFADWPVDPDIQRREKLKRLEKEPASKRVGRATKPLIPLGTDAQVTMSATAGQDAGNAPCPADAKLGTCKQADAQPSHYGVATPNWNPLTWVGLQKKPATVLGPEPDRDWLTDPPKGLRAPIGGPGVKVDN